MKKIFLFFAMAIVSLSTALAQHIPVVPDDPAVRKGVLDNGLTYYIRHNAKPEKQAEFWIFHNVGAIQEEDSQQGLAHFLEHMAFNGTKNFPDKNMITWLESIGVKFGANLNAATGTEMTFYHMSSVPLLRESIVDSALLVLHDWSYFISLESPEIDNERGVIVEELRTRQDANWRVREKMAPYLYGDNRYAHRNIIGHEDYLRTFDHKELRDFYHRWYRTDLQTIVIVGDIDVDQMEAKIKRVMADIPRVENPEPKQYINIPDNVEPIITVITDPELTGTSASVYFKRPTLDHRLNNTEAAALSNFFDAYISRMAGERTSDIARSPGAPFLGAGIRTGGNINATTDASTMNVNAREGEILTAFEAAYTEVEKIRRFGFTEQEFERAKAAFARSIEDSYETRSDRRNGDFVWTYINNFVQNDMMPSAEYEYELDKKLLGMITLEDVNSFAKRRLTNDNQVVIVTMPAKEGAVIPSEGEFAAIIDKVHNADIKSEITDIVARPLIPEGTRLKGSKVRKTTTDMFGATVWELRNGIKVVVKPTDYKADEVIMSVSSPGGKSVLSVDELLTADALPSYIGRSGIGDFSASELRKQLTGKRANVGMSLGNYSNGLSGSASAKDIETLMQLTYLYFTSPRWDKADFDVMIDALRSQYANIASNPQFKLQGEYNKTLYGDNPRRHQIQPEDVERISFEQLRTIYDELYGNPDDFTFTIVGNVDLDALRPLVEKYLGSLPRTKQKFGAKDDGVRFAQGKVQNIFTTRMQMPKATVIHFLNGPMEYSLENTLAMSFLSQILDMRYQESVREEKGGTYGVSSSGGMGYFPVEQYTLSIMFDTDPAMVDELTELILKEIEIIARDGVRTDDLAKVKEYYNKAYPDQIRQNNYWLGRISSWHLYGFDMNTGYLDIVNGFTPDYFKALASKILSDGNVIYMVMGPDGK